MAIKGSLKEASLPDVLQLLSMGKKTGCLSVTHRNNFGNIYFDKGRISYASIVNRRDRLGDMLVKNGVITQAQLDQAVALQVKQRDKRLGELLVELESLSREQLHQFIRIQIEEAVYYLFTWNQGTFNFEADVEPEEQDLIVSINPESLLLEGARRVDEWSLIEKKISGFDLIFEVDQQKAKSSDVDLTPEQRAVLDLVDGRRDITQIIDESGLVEFEVGKALYGLVTAGFIHRVGRSKAQVDDSLAEERVEEHRNLGVAFYKTGMLEEALREFRRVTELRPDDSGANFFIGLVLTRQGRYADAVLAYEEALASNKRPAVYHNLAFALERLGRYDDAHVALENAAKHGGAKDPRVQTSIGIVSLLAGDVAAANEALMAARPLFGSRPPTAAWFHYAGLSAALLGDHDRAIAVLTEGAEAHPHAATLFNNLAVVHERRSQWDAALATLEKGLVEDPGLAQLQKNIGDLHYRAARYDEALEAYQRAVKAQPELGDDVYLKLGNIRFRKHERDEAVRCWERALELDPANAIVRTNLEAVKQAL